MHHRLLLVGDLHHGHERNNALCFASVENLVTEFPKPPPCVRKADIAKYERFFDPLAIAARSAIITHPLFFIYNMSQLTLLADPQLICLCNYYEGRSGWKALQLHLAAAAAVVAYRKHPLVAW